MLPVIQILCSKVVLSENVIPDTLHLVVFGKEKISPFQHQNRKYLWKEDELFDISRANDLEVIIEENK